MVIFDSTAPHEYFPDRASDEIIDVYKTVIAAGTDEKYASQITDIIQRYSAKMTEATSYLARAKSLHDDLEKFYIGAMNFAKVERLQQEIDSEIARITDSVKGF